RSLKSETKVGAGFFVFFVYLLPLQLNNTQVCQTIFAGNANLSACQHLRRAESRRAKALQPNGGAAKVRIPRCRKSGEFESIQCANERAGEDCWCIDEYGVELPGTRNESRVHVRCEEPAHCAASACRMFCPSGFARDPATGCSVCRCRDPCDSIDCPNGQSCQLQEVQCKSEPCPPLPTCKKARSLANYCPAGLPLAIDDSVRPFLCGLDAGKPQCPPLYQCLVESGNDYGVCCPSALNFQKPGVCPAPEQTPHSERTGYMCGAPCTHDLECRNMDKCCFSKGCQFNCQQPNNVTGCHQARALANVLAISEREGRGYVPDCNGPGGQYAPRQCSRNGLVCWCVDPRTGHKIKESMGAAQTVNCDGWENMISRSYARSFQMQQCDTNICAAICEYGFKNDHNGCPSCECAEPCEGFKCAIGSHCEVATDPACESSSGSSALCASWPICKPDLAYSNPCTVGTPLTDAASAELMYCFEEQERQARSFQPRAFFEPEPESQAKQGRAMSNRIMCPADYKCTKLHRDTESVCCPLPEPEAEQSSPTEESTTRQQTMCEYLRDFSERMEGTEEGMQLAIAAPMCNEEGDYQPRQCELRKIRVTRAEQRKILEENTIRRMRMLLSSASAGAPKRSRREAERLKLYRVDDSLLKVQVAAPVMARSAKVIDMGQHLGQQQLFETDLKKVLPASKRPNVAAADEELVELEVEQCWCVDSFGTEIPQSRGFNVSLESCQQLREQLDCLDLTCRMGCEYGFALDAETRCPACQCRDPCEGVTNCGEGKECRIVDVSCEGEYCPPVPACLPRKPGQCPYLVPPGPTDSCAYECRTDAHCAGSRRCCSNGCGTQCVEPQLKTACQHLQSVQLHQSSELGIPARQMHIAQCDAQTGAWEQVQCSPAGQCWCVDAQGQQLAGTKVEAPSKPVCKANSSFACPQSNCSLSCESGYQSDEHGCPTCACRNYCDELSCAVDEECQLISVECVDAPCPKLPICVPRRESVCAEGKPLQQGGLDVSCGPHNEQEACPSTHSCQLNPVSNRGVCCAKTRDVCFESQDKLCLASASSTHNSTRYRFSPKANKCLAVNIDLDAASCQTKNLFHNELACNSVCPVLTQCERLKVKNSLAAQRTGHSSVWFQPRCDPVTGHWSPVQCLGKQPALSSLPRPTEVISRAFASSQEQATPYGVCWCADRKGAPLKGSLTRDQEPSCNSRQARNRQHLSDAGDPLMEQLIGQLTLLNDVNQEMDFDELEQQLLLPQSTAAPEMISGRNLELELANSLLDSQLSVESSTLQPLQVKSTRCQALAKTASFPVSCDDAGAFKPLQCNGRSCWCVDAAGNQLQSTHIFGQGDRHCEVVPIEAVAIELHMSNSSGRSVRNVYDAIKRELLQLLGDVLENLRVQENFDGSVIVRFELHHAAKVDLAFAIESAISAGEFQLVNGLYQADLTRSHFIHRTAATPQAQAVHAEDESVQLAMFVLASCSAFLVSVFVVYVMLKRGWHKGFNQKIYEYETPTKSEKPVDYSLPIFVLDDTQPESIKAKA
ncbi:CG5639, partial [Drosophila busckii]